MEKIADRSFIGETVTLDGRAFVRCDFSNCILVFRGEATFAFSECKTETTVLKLEGPAHRTITTLQQMLHSENQKFAAFAADLVRQIQQPPKIKQS